MVNRLNGGITALDENTPKCRGNSQKYPKKTSSLTTTTKNKIWGENGQCATDTQQKKVPIKNTQKIQKNKFPPISQGVAIVLLFTARERYTQNCRAIYRRNLGGKT
eukprot:GEMP01081384.1.p2 GENE.GEMP01081384.1~~GEMP01081384.1.p2  ORF type:complete len:106 (-),score=2.79 GEMP01081384.1:467-784(-)